MGWCTLRRPRAAQESKGDEARVAAPHTARDYSLARVATPHTATAYSLASGSTTYSPATTKGGDSTTYASANGGKSKGEGKWLFPSQRSAGKGD